ncbi:HFL240Wp [Eremothecium sinecaudum]|uniref:HFL240Wp n=1 Tax=Eremothecium sinecaudum TaxID=45286 RepID=A0A109UXP0_9SACH|nr:HFL240Wp [Eremothecium sinecaudum]AMD21616.1 HFL240Wp [Eremothecium sinecaudum]
MEYLALSPVQFNIWSSDPGLISYTLFVSASPKASVARLLQYIHWCLFVRNVDKLERPSNYCLKYMERELDLTELCSDISGGSGIIRLQFDIRSDDRGANINLDYNVDTEFLTTNVQFQVNTLSMDKYISVVKYGLPLNITTVDLRRLACNILNEYECTSPKNICHIKDHLPEDLVAFQIAGKSHPVVLSPEYEKKYGDLTLKDLLGFDFVPSHSSHCSIMFRSEHGQNTDGVTIEFVSDSTLTMKTMNVTMDTTVDEVKEFICSVYGHTLRLSPSDVRLIYSGQLVHDRNFSGSPSKILEYISDTNHTKLHVKITQEYLETGPGFWSELFNSPDRFSFHPTRTSSSAVDAMRNTNARGAMHAARGTSTAYGASVSNSMSRSASNINANRTIPQNESEAVEVDPQNSDQRVYTEAGDPLHRTGELFERVLVNGSSFFVSKQELEPNINELSISGHVIRMCSDEFRVLSDQILLKPHIARKIESILGTTIEKVPVSTRPPQHVQYTVSTDVTTNRVTLRQVWHQISTYVWIQTTFNYLKLILQSVYVLAYNSGAIALLFYLVATGIVPTTAHILTFFSMFAISFIRSLGIIFELWIDFYFGKEYPISEEEQQRLHEALAGHIEPSFFARFHRCNNAKAVEEALMATLTENTELKLMLCETYDIKSNLSLRVIVPRILQRCDLPEYRNKTPDQLRMFFDSILSNIERNLTNTNVLSVPELELLKQLRIYVYSTLPQGHFRFKPVFLRAVHTFSEFCSDTLMRHTVPDPSKDSFAISLLKNATLFILLCFPSFQTKFEDIMAERVFWQSEESQQEEAAPDAPQIEQNDGNDGTNPSPQDLIENSYESQVDYINSTGNEGATGFQLHEVNTNID